MPVIAEPARAKINLTLEVRGKRPDGYHELRSLVLFAGLADGLELRQGEAYSLTVDGPYADAIQGPNLIERAASAVRQAVPAARLGAFHLEKALPVAAGIGGGSADAAAALRALARANPGRISAPVLDAIARSLGADVPACVASKPLIMEGIGHEIRPLPAFPPLPAVLVNPGVMLSTVDVFRALAAPPLGPASAPDGTTPTAPSGILDIESVLALAAASRNDLEGPAIALRPAIGAVLAALRAEPRCRLSRMSGSGPTCFGLFAETAEADAACARLSSAHPGWWIRATTLG